MFNMGSFCKQSIYLSTTVHLLNLSPSVLKCQCYGNKLADYIYLPKTELFQYALPSDLVNSYSSILVMDCTVQRVLADVMPTLHTLKCNVNSRWISTYTNPLIS